MEERYKVEMGISYRMCEKCKKSFSEYYELKTQIRFREFDNENEIKKQVLKVLEKLHGEINKIDEVDGGFDVFFRKHSAMNSVGKLFGFCLFEEKRSKKLVGRDFLVSKDKYKYSQSIVLINIKVGDKIVLKGREYEVRSINRGKELVVFDLESFKKERYLYSKIKDYLRKV